MASFIAAYLSACLSIPYLCLTQESADQEIPKLQLSLPVTRNSLSSYEIKVTLGSQVLLLTIVTADNMDYPCMLQFGKKKIVYCLAYAVKCINFSVIVSTKVDQFSFVSMIAHCS